MSLLEIKDENGKAIITKKTFCENTTFDPMAFSRFKKVGYIPKMSTLITFCVAFSFDMPMTRTLLHSLALDFKLTNKVHYAYSYLITDCRGKSIHECNQVLGNFGIERKYYLGNKNQ